MEEAKRKESKHPEKTDEKAKDKDKGQQPKDKEKDKKEEQELVSVGIFFSFRFVLVTSQEPEVLFCLSHCRFDNMVEQA